MKEETMDKIYKKGQSASAAGPMYQIKLLALFLLRGDNKLKDFHLATEMTQDDVGKFDDVVFSFTDEKNIKKSILLQAKHSSSDSKKCISTDTLLSIKDKDFGLAIFLHSYIVKIKGNEDLGVLDGLVLFTNRSINKSIQDIAINTLSDCTLLQTCKINTNGKFYKLPEHFVSELKYGVITHHCNLLARRLISTLLYKQTVILDWSTKAFRQLESSILCNIFDFIITESENAHIKGFKQSFIDGDVHLNKVCLIFRNALIEEINEKSSKILKEINNEELLIDGLFGLKNINMIFDKFHVKVEGVIVINGEHLSSGIVADEDVAKFAELFVLAVDQPNVDDLDEKIKEILNQHRLFQNISLESAVKHLLSQISQWFEAKIGIFLDERKTTLILNDVYLELTSSFHIWQNNPSQISFENRHVDEIYNRITGCKERLVQISTKGSCKLLMSLIHQTLFANKYVYLDLPLIVQKLSEDVDLITFFRNSTSFLGIVINFTHFKDYERTTVVNVIEKLVASDKKVIILRPFVNNPLRDGFKKIQNWTFELFEMDVEFRHLSDECQKGLLSRKNINIHGRQCSLRDILLGIDLTKIIDQELLDDLVNEKTLAIGVMRNPLLTLPAAYTNTYQCVSLDCFLELLYKYKYKFAINVCGCLHQAEIFLLNVFEKKQDIFTDNITYEENMDIRKSIILFDDNEFDSYGRRFQSICEKIENKIIFYIRFERDSLFLCQIYNPFYYIKRQLKYVEKVIINKSEIINCLKEKNGKKFFVISSVANLDVLKKLLYCGKEQENLIEWSKITNFQDQNAEKYFEDKCVAFDEVHWFDLQSGELVWIKSFGSLDIIRRSKHKTKVYDEDDFIKEVSNKLVLISNDAGMGKSTTMISFAQRLMTSRCVFMINFKEDVVQKHLEILSSNVISIKNILNFICSVDSSNKSIHLTRFILNYYFEAQDEKSNILVLIFDSMDEAPKKLQKTAKQMIRYLKENSVCTIYVTARKNYAQSIEDSFSVLSTALEDICEEKQCEFLVQHWDLNLAMFSNRFSQETLNTKAKEVLCKMSTLTNMALGYLALPLYLRLVSDIMLEYIIENKHLDHLFNNLNQLFGKFIDIRYKVYFKEKTNYLFHDPSHISILTKHFWEAHSKLAFQTLFPTHFQNIGLNMNKEMNELVSSYLLIGLLHYKNSGEISFYHRSFSEYYCALFLKSSLDNKDYNETFYKMTLNVVKNDLFLPIDENPYKILETFLNSMLFEDLSLHKAIFCGDLNEFQLMMNQVDVTKRNEVDKVGRSALHVCAQYGNYMMILSMLNCHWESFHTDVMDKTALHYAVKNEDFQNVEYLVAPYVDFNIHNSILLEPPKECGEKPFNVFAGNKYYESSVLNRIINKKDLDQNTCLYYAAKLKKWLLCCWLIAHGADCRVLAESQEHELLSTLINIFTYEDFDKHITLLPSLTLLLYRNQSLINNLDQHYCFPKLFSKLLRSGETTIAQNLLMFCPSNDRVRILNQPSGFFYPLDNVIGSAKYLSDSDYLKIHKFLFEHRAFSLANYSKSSNGFLAFCLQYSALWGHLETFKYLVQFGESEYRRSSHNKGSFLDYLFQNNTLWMNYFDDVRFNTYIKLAMEFNHRSLVEYIWESFRNATIDKSGHTALMAAALCGKIKYVQYLCDKGCDVKCVNILNKSALHFAAERSNIDVIKCLVSKGADVNLYDMTLNTVLDMVLDLSFNRNCPFDYNSKYECVKYLVLNCKASSFHDVDESDKRSREQIMEASHETVNNLIDGSTLLHKAVKMNIELFVKYLLDLGADVNAQDINGLTPLESIEKRSSICNILFKYGARFSHTTKHLLPKVYRNTSLYSTSDLFISNSLWEDISVYILRNNELCAVDGENPMIYIMRVQDNNGQTLVHRAALLNDCKALSIIIEHDKGYQYYEKQFQHIDSYIPVNYSTKDHNGDTPLHIASRNGCMDVIGLLIKNGAMYNSINILGQTPEEFISAKIHENCDIFNTVSEYFYKVKGNYLHEIEKMLVDDSFLKIRDKSGKTLLHWAVYCGHLAMSELLINKGANIDAVDCEGQTSLHHAVKNQSLDLTCILLNSGAIFNCIDKMGKQPLDLLNNDLFLFKMMKTIQEIFDSMRRNELDKVLNDIQSIESDAKIVKALVHTRDRLGNNLLHHAAECGSLEVISFIMKNGGIYDMVNNFKSPVSLTHNPIIYRLLTSLKELFANNLNRSFINFVEEGHLTECILNVRNIEGDTLLHRVQDVYLAKWLVKNTKNIDVMDKLGRTPLMRALMRKNMFIVKIIYEGGASISRQAFNGDSVLHMAVRSGDWHIVSYIINMGAANYLLLENLEGYTPIHIALSMDNVLILDNLLKLFDNTLCGNDFFNSFIIKLAVGAGSLISWTVDRI